MLYRVGDSRNVISNWLSSCRLYGSTISKKILAVVTPDLCMISLFWIVPFTTPIAGALGTILTVLMSVISSFVVGFNVMVLEHSLGGISNSLEPWS